MEEEIEDPEVPAHPSPRDQAWNPIQDIPDINRYRLSQRWDDEKDGWTQASMAREEKGSYVKFSDFKEALDMCQQAIQDAWDMYELNRNNIIGQRDHIRAEVQQTRTLAWNLIHAIRKGDDVSEEAMKYMLGVANRFRLAEANWDDVEDQDRLLLEYLGPGRVDSDPESEKVYIETCVVPKSNEKLPKISGQFTFHLMVWKRSPIERESD